MQYKTYLYLASIYRRAVAADSEAGGAAAGGDPGRPLQHPHGAAGDAEDRGGGVHPGLHRGKHALGLSRRDGRG